MAQVSTAIWALHMAPLSRGTWTPNLLQPRAWLRPIGWTLGWGHTLYLGHWAKPWAHLGLTLAWGPLGVSGWRGRAAGRKEGRPTQSLHPQMQL